MKLKIYLCLAVSIVLVSCPTFQTEGKTIEEKQERKGTFRVVVAKLGGSPIKNAEVLQLLDEVVVSGLGLVTYDDKLLADSVRRKLPPEKTKCGVHLICRAQTSASSIRKCLNRIEKLADPESDTTVVLYLEEEAQKDKK